MKTINWKSTVIHHKARKKLGLSSDEYVFLDLIYNTQTSPVYSVDGWCEHPYSVLASVVGIKKGGAFQMANRMVNKGYLDVNPANPKQKKTTPSFFLYAKYDVDEDQENNVVIVQKVNASVQKVNGKRSESERKRSESERQIKVNKVIVKDNKRKGREKEFSPPSKEEVLEYFTKKLSSLDGIIGPGHWAKWETNKFMDYYETVKWKVGRAKMKDWKRAVSGWVNRGLESRTYLRTCPLDPNYTQNIKQPVQIKPLKIHRAAR